MVECCNLWQRCYQSKREVGVSVHNVANKHSWSDGQNFPKCAHGTLSNRDKKEIQWLKPGSPAHIAFEDVVTNPRLLKNLGKLTDFCDTGELEIYHSLTLKYCSKREPFSYKDMQARIQLAALDNNANTGREQAVITSGEKAGERRYKKSFPKA